MTCTFSSCWVGVSLVLLLFVLLPWLAQRPRHTLKGRRVLVSGCDRGMGRALALHLWQEGAEVFAGCLTAEGARSLKKETGRTAAGKMHALVLDVTSSESVAATIAFINSNPPSSGSGSGRGGLDVLVNNAGVMSSSFLAEMTPLSSFERNMSVNFLGAVRLTQASLPLLRRAVSAGRGPRVVNVTSFLGRVAPLGLSAYSCSKFAGEAFSDCLRQELLGQGIHVAIVEPGSTNTDMAQEMLGATKRCWDRAPEKRRTKLGETYIRAMNITNFCMKFLGRDVSAVVPEMEHAVCARWPKSRYVCGWDCWALGVATPLLPTRVADVLTLALMGWPRPDSSIIDDDNDNAVANPSSSSSESSSLSVAPIGADAQQSSEQATEVAQEASTLTKRH